MVVFMAGILWFVGACFGLVSLAGFIKEKGADRASSLPHLSYLLLEGIFIMVMGISLKVLFG